MVVVWWTMGIGLATHAEVYSIIFPAFQEFIPDSERNIYGLECDHEHCFQGDDPRLLSVVNSVHCAHDIPSAGAPHQMRRQRLMVRR